MKYRIDIIRADNRRGYFARVLLPYVDGEERGERIVHATPSCVSRELARRYARHWLSTACAAHLVRFGEK